MQSTDPLAALDPAYKSLLRLKLGGVALAVLIASTAAEIAIPGWTGVVWLPALFVAGYALLRAPLRRYHATGYSLTGQRLRIVRGILFRSDSVVPFGRVQHIDVDQGPLERLYGLATLTVHTAGTHNASVALPGLAQGEAIAMRETIRAAIGHQPE